MRGGWEGRRRSDRESKEDPAWEYLARVPQDAEYPFHSLRWERLVGRQELPLEEDRLAPVEAPDLLRLAERLAREAKLCERESAVFRRWVEGCSQGESARRLALRKVTVGSIWKEVRAKIAALLEETG